MPRRSPSALLPALSGLLLLGFVGVLGVGAVIGAQPTMSALDGRQLAEFPDPTLAGIGDGSWMSSTEGWLDDHVPGRDSWLEWHARFARQALRQQVIGNVFVGDPRGMLLRKMPNWKVPRKLAADAQALGAEVRNAGSTLLSVYVPRPEEVFADRVPAAWPQMLAKNKPAVTRALAKAGPLLDLTKTLSDPAHRDDYFWRTDHHWTSVGALAGLRAISAEAARLGVTIPADTRKYHTATFRTFYGSNGRTVTAGGTPAPDLFSAQLPDTLRARLCTDNACDRPTLITSLANDPDTYADRYRAFAGGDLGYLRFENHSPEAAGSILLLKDSYGDALSVYLAERVSNLVSIDERYYTGGDITDMVRSMHPDLVILMHNQITLLDASRFDPNIWTDTGAAIAHRRPGQGGPGG